MTTRQVIVLVTFIVLEVAGVALARMNPSGPRVWIAPALMTTALVAFMIWLFWESRREGRK
jgi:hypothetical protein